MIRTNYCTHCDRPPIDSHAKAFTKGKAKVEDLTSRLATHLNITKKAIKAHPIASALLATAFLACVVASVVLFSIGFGGAGIFIIGMGGNILLGGSALLYRARKQIEAKEFKINHAFNSNNTSRIQKKKVCLVLEAAYDNNGAFRMDKGPAKWEKKYPLVHVQVSSIEEVDNAIRQVKQFADIQVLWFAAHGNQNGMQLSKDKFIHMQNVDALADTFKCLDPNAVIVLNGCETAKTTKGQTANIAEKISEVAERRVLGSSVKIGRSQVDSSLRIKMKKVNRQQVAEQKASLGIQVARWGSKKENIKEKVQAHLCEITSAYTPRLIGKHFEKSALRVYKNGLLNQPSKYVEV